MERGGMQVRALGLMAHRWPVHQVMEVGNLRLVGELNKLFDVILETVCQRQNLQKTWEST